MNKTIIMSSILVFASILAHARIPLFKCYPSLEKNIPYCAFGSLPTPLESCPQLSHDLSCKLSIKRDDLAGSREEDGTKLFGGNKIRKLEFLLADAIDRGATDILTLGGCTGSNHVTATALYAHKFGIRTHCLLADQPLSWVVKRNQKLMKECAANLHYYSTTDQRNAGLSKHEKEIFNQTGQKPYTIPVGGSVPLGIIGFINAAFELQEQISQGFIQAPDCIYIPAGSLGSAVGLLIGLQLLKAHTQIVAVAIEPGEIALPLKKLFEETKEFLVTYDTAFEALSWNEQCLRIHTTFAGKGYGYATKESKKALELFESVEGIILEHTYSAKAAAALINDAKKGLLKDKQVLLWYTFYAGS